MVLSSYLSGEVSWSSLGSTCLIRYDLSDAMTMTAGRDFMLCFVCQANDFDLARSR